MKLRDVIATGFKIAEGKSQLFIAEIDFDYNGLPILKDSLVYYDGKSELRINMVEFALFKDKNLPGSVSKS